MNNIYVMLIALYMRLHDVKEVQHCLTEDKGVRTRASVQADKVATLEGRVTNTEKPGVKQRRN